MSQLPMNSMQNGTAAKPESLARRTRLREFQTELVQRIQAAQNSPETSISRLGVLIGDTHCLFDLQQTSEIMPVRSITKVPLTQDWYLGLSSIRGNLVGVVDFSRFIGHAGTEIDSECRTIIFSRELSLHGGLLVSRVLGLRNPQQMTAAPESDQRSGLSPWVTRRYHDAQSQLWMQIDLAALVQDPRFLQIGL